MNDRSTLVALVVVFAVFVLAVLAFTLRSHRRLTPEQRETMRARQGDDPLADPRWHDSHRGQDERSGSPGGDSGGDSGSGASSHD